MKKIGEAQSDEERKIEWRKTHKSDRGGVTRVEKKL